MLFRRDVDRHHAAHVDVLRLERGWKETLR